MSNYYNKFMPDWKNKKAKEMRQHMTVAEKTLWGSICKKKWIGCKFRAQVPLYGYIADFMCPQKKLIIEVDGKYHVERKEEDRLRDERLSNKGFQTIRFTNEEVLNNLPKVLQDIREVLRPKTEKITVKWISAPKLRKRIRLLPRKEKRVVKQEKLFLKLISLEKNIRESKLSAYSTTNH